MRRRWLTVVRNLLRSLKRAPNPKPEHAELEQLRVAIYQTYEPAASENIDVITDLVMSDCSRECTQWIVKSFDYQVQDQRPRLNHSSEQVACRLRVWLVEGLVRRFTNNVENKWRPVLRIQNDSYSRGVRPELTITSKRGADSADGCLYVSIIVRKDSRFGTWITSAELYTLIWMAAKQASAQPSKNSLQVRMMVIYSKWVQVFTAKTTRRYVISIIEGWDEIADQMEIYQTQWFDFTDISCQQQILLFAMESIKLEVPVVKKQRVPLEDAPPSTQNSKPLKREFDVEGEQSSKKQKGEHEGSVIKETSALV